jgi:hypothetical protein
MPDNTVGLTMPGSTSNTSSLANISGRGLYIHYLPGRLRISAPRLTGDLDFAARLKASVEALPGVTSVEPAAITSRVLVLYRPDVIRVETILEAMQRLGCFAGPATQQRLLIAPSDDGLGNVVLKVAAETLLKHAVEAAISALL